MLEKRSDRDLKQRVLRELKWDSRIDWASINVEVTDAVASFEWDLPTVQQLHRALSEEMKKESVAVTNFVPLPA